VGEDEERDSIWGGTVPTIPLQDPLFDIIFSWSFFPMCSTDKNLDFAELEVGAIFDHRGTLYRKLNNESASVLGAGVSDTVHRFYPEDPVTLADEHSPGSD
jgi:hypothetical protein